MTNVRRLAVLALTVLGAVATAAAASAGTDFQHNETLVRDGKGGN